MSTTPEAITAPLQEPARLPGWTDNVRELTCRLASNRVVTSAVLLYVGAEAKLADVSGQAEKMDALPEEAVTAGGHLPIGYLGALIIGQTGLALKEKIKPDADAAKTRKHRLIAALGGASTANVIAELTQDSAAGKPMLNFITSMPFESLKDAGVAGVAGLIYFAQFRWRRRRSSKAHEAGSPVE